jgi:hypothetical protein
MTESPARKIGCPKFVLLSCIAALLGSSLASAAPPAQKGEVSPEMSTSAVGPRGGGILSGGPDGTCPCVDTEGEPIDCSPDAFNGGCNSSPPVFSPIQCGQTVCGESGTFVGPLGNTRDTDWWRFTLVTPSFVTWTVTAEFPVLIGLIAQPCPQGAFIVSAVGNPCVPVTVTSACLPAGDYVAFVAPSAFTGVPCGDHYTGTLSCESCVRGACCLKDGCVVLSEANCIAQCGSYQGDNTNCGIPIYTASNCTTPLEDISATGTLSTVTGTDDNSQTGVPIGFPFQFFGNIYTTCTINMNGFITFDSLGAGFFSNVAIPNAALPNNMVAPFWDDLYSVLQGNVRYQTLAGPTRFIVQWTNVQRFPGVGTGNTLQLILYQSNRNIEFRYGVLEGSPPLTGTVGIENADGTVGLSIDPVAIGTGNTCRHINKEEGQNPCLGCWPCPADITLDGQVNVNDLLQVINNWGPCP